MSDCMIVKFKSHPDWPDGTIGVAYGDIRKFVWIRVVFTPLRGTKQDKQIETKYLVEDRKGLLDAWG